MLIHTKSAEHVATPKMLPVCTNVTGNALDGCMLDDDDVSRDPNNDDDDAESVSDPDL